MQQLAEHRDRVVDLLSSGFAADRLEVEEYERRVTLAHEAQSPAALDALVMDLVSVRPPGALVATATALVPATHLRVLFGSIERVGPWTVPSQLTARVVCGNVLLDLRDARLSPVTTIDVNVTMGNIEILVPPGVAIEMDASPLLGNVEDRTEPGVGAANLVRVTGRVKLGNARAMTLLRGETRREARWRRRAERRHVRWRRRPERLEERMQWQRRYLPPARD
ncbi:MAG: DUF1707 domain-containing protein [Kofleriaceae bacterium]